MQKRTVQVLIAGGFAVALYGVYVVAEPNICWKGKLYEAVKEEARAQIISPSSAIFPDFEDVAERHSLGGCYFHIDGDFEAQNSFGAMIRTRMSGSVMRTSDGDTSANILVSSR